MIVESSNPAHSIADSAACREAFEALELLVVIDVTMTETARLAHYMLPAANQFEKCEATFFNLEFPHNTFSTSAPAVRAVGGHPARTGDLGPADARARGGHRGGAAATAGGRREGTGRLPSGVLRRGGGTNLRLNKTLPFVLYETLGPTLPEGPRRCGRAVGTGAEGADDLPRRCNGPVTPTATRCSPRSSTAGPG